MLWRGLSRWRGGVLLRDFFLVTFVLFVRSVYDTHESMDLLLLYYFPSPTFKREKTMI